MKERQAGKSTGETTKSFLSCNKLCTTALVPKESFLISVVAKAGYLCLHSLWKVVFGCVLSDADVLKHILW